MTPFAETSFLCSLYRKDCFSGVVDGWVRDWGRPIPLSTLVVFEFRQSIRLHTLLHQSNPETGLCREDAIRILRDFDADRRGGVLSVFSADWPSIHERAEILSEKHTWGCGHRFADILQVATALYLGRDTFLTFDSRQAEMASAEGL